MLSILRPSDDFFRFSPNPLAPYLLSPRDATEAAMGRLGVRDEGEVYRLTIDLPGTSRDSLDVSVEPGRISVSGERRRAGQERPSRFSFAASLPNAADLDGARATYVDGVLEVTLPKAAAAKPRKLDVRAG